MPIPRRTFYFLRHGQTDWNAEGRFQGHTDIPLNARGVAQAHEAARILADCPIDLIAASPLVRARKTAEIVAQAIGKPLLVDDELKERQLRRLRGAHRQRRQAQVRARAASAPGSPPARRRRAVA